MLKTAGRMRQHLLSRAGPGTFNVPTEADIQCAIIKYSARTKKVTKPGAKRGPSGMDSKYTDALLANTEAAFRHAASTVGDQSKEVKICLERRICAVV